MRKKLPVLLIVLIILMQAFIPVTYATSKNEEQFKTAYFCPSDATSKGAGNAVSNKSIVIGEGMQDIKTVAKQLQAEGVDAKWYQAWSKNFPNNRPMTPDELNAALARNQRWIDSKIKQGYDIYDIGTDPLRTTRSPFYELEQSRINKYGYPTIDITGRRP